MSAEGSRCSQPLDGLLVGRALLCLRRKNDELAAERFVVVVRQLLAAGLPPTLRSTQQKMSDAHRPVTEQHGGRGVCHPPRDPSRRRKNGETALDVAIRLNKPNTRRLLEDHERRRRRSSREAKAKAGAKAEANAKALKVAAEAAANESARELWRRRTDVSSGRNAEPRRSA